MERIPITTEQYISVCVRQIRREKLGFEINLADHCNLNCQSCNHFFPIAEQYYLPVEKFEKDMLRIVEQTGGDIERIWLIGGEPLLHPDLVKIIYLTRDFFPFPLLLLIQMVR